MPFSERLRIFFISIIFIAIVTACDTKKESASVQVEPTITKSITPTSIISTNTPVPQTFSVPAIYGPNIENFPTDFNPLTGQQVKDSSQLQVPALLVSISHFPPAARPQYGLSFAPWVFEFYITEGATRFLSVFYGTFPEAEALVTGGCEIRTEVFKQTKNIIGNYVWL